MGNVWDDDADDVNPFSETARCLGPCAVCKFTGLHMTWREDGIKVECHYTEGVLDGDYREWFPDVTPRVECSYRGGHLYGVYRRWFRNGNLMRECHYEDGRRRGLYRSWYESGHPNEAYDVDHGGGRDVRLDPGEIIVWARGKAEGVGVLIKLLVPREAGRGPGPGPDAHVEFAYVVHIIDDRGRKYRKAHGTDTDEGGGEGAGEGGGDEYVAGHMVYSKGETGLRVRRYRDRRAVTRAGDRGRSGPDLRT